MENHKYLDALISVCKSPDGYSLDPIIQILNALKPDWNEAQDPFVELSTAILKFVFSCGDQAFIGLMPAHTEIIPNIFQVN